MGIVVDIIILLILALSIFLGYKKGLVAVAIRICALILALVITFILYKPISNFIINATAIDESIENSIIENANKMIEKNNDSKIIDEAKEKIVPGAARNIAVKIITVGVALLLFLVARIGIVFITALADAIAKLPLLKQFNEAGGALYGAIRGIVLIYIVLIFITLFTQFNPNNIINESIEKSYAGKMMYENNVFNVIFKWNLLQIKIMSAILMTYFLYCRKVLLVGGVSVQDKYGGL